jgi:hypothetical protein
MSRLTRRAAAVLFFAVVAPFLSLYACARPETPLPDPLTVPTSAPAPAPAPHQGGQASVIIPVPASGASAWVRSELVRITSFGLSGAATGADAVNLRGTNDNTIAVTAGAQLGAFAGGVFYQNIGQQGFNVGGYEYLAVIRTFGSTSDLTFIVVGDDGVSSGSSSSGGPSSTVNQGLPGDAGPWPVRTAPQRTDQFGSVDASAGSFEQASGSGVWLASLFGASTGDAGMVVLVFDGDPTAPGGPVGLLAATLLTGFQGNGLVVPSPSVAGSPYKNGLFMSYCPGNGGGSCPGLSTIFAAGSYTNAIVTPGP